MNNFWKTLELLLIGCETNPILTSSPNCIILFNTVANQATISPINDTKCYVLIVTLSTQDTAKLLQQLKSSFKGTINWTKYQSKVTDKINI